MTSVIFTNWTKEDFSWTWNSVPYTFRAGQSIYIEDYLANHFAKHLVDRELIRAGKQVNDHSRQSLIDKCISAEEQKQAESPEKLSMEILNKNKAAEAKAPFCTECDSKGLRHKKNCPASVRKEEGFEGLDAQQA